MEKRFAMIPRTSLSPPLAGPSVHDIRPAAPDPLWRAAQALEAGFLSELLRLSDPGTPDAGLGGGPGEAQFRSFLIEAQAERITAAGGIGLARKLYTAMGGPDR